MKYQCAKCNEVFTHTAKTVENFESDSGDIVRRLVSMTVTVEGIPLHAEWEEVHQTAIALRRRIVGGTVETAVCPFCHNVKFSEYIEPIEELEDVISVEYVNVGAKIAEGYKVKEIYAKSVTLVKPKKKVEGDYIQEAMEKARQP
jgi:hypothetical protein